MINHLTFNARRRLAEFVSISGNGEPRCTSILARNYYLQRF